MADAFKDDAGAVPLNLIVLLDRAHDDGRHASARRARTTP